MIKQTFLGLACAGAVLVVAVQTDTKPEVTVDRRYETADGQKVEGLGVCDISAEKMDCWDMDGKRSSEINGLLRLRLAGQYALDIRAKFGVKNRFLVLALTNARGIGVNTAPGSHKAMPIFSPSQPTLWLIRATPAEGDKTDSTMISLSEKLASPAFQVAFRKGAKATKDGLSVEFGSASPALGPVLPFVGFHPDAKKWTIAVSVEGVPKGSSLILRPLDADGKPIHAVDKSGEPVSNEAYDDWFRKIRGRSVPITELKYDTVRFQRDFGSGATAFLMYTNLNPKRISRMAVSLNRSKYVLITGFPLDPTP